ncbi:DNA polymerase I [Clostridium aciditolerans]|uniref:DNA polymerase I n=1 Tax=Clostridium aciditolerans TaxID=339861 RepID=A0A934HUH9_9CLOT|nr:DNA polymerase I [Clostridium aciditolerans]MBI6871644.1 DNA polymerase I [Clostridium aciditolerans]
MTKERLLILDGNSLMNRAFYALPPLTNSEGLHTNAVYGFITMLLKMKEEISPNYIVSTFDRSAPTFRHSEYKEYKAGRKKMPEELAEQFPVVKELLELLSINIFEIDGFEADDLIGTLSTFAENKDIEVYIVTGDRDALQLASDNIKVIITKKGITEKEIYDGKRMVEEHGVTPSQFIDVKGLMGDSSDNIPGVPGIGEKTAFKLIKEYGSIENVLSNIDNISGKKIKENLHQYSEQAIFSKKLATIMKDVPIDIDLDSIKSKENYNAEGLRKLFMRLQFKTLINKIPGIEKGSENIDIESEESDEEQEVIFESIDKIDRFKDVSEQILAVCKNKNELLYMTFKIADASVYSKNYIEKIFVNLKENNYVVEIKQLMDVNEEQVINLLKSILEDKNIQKVSHDVKMPHTILRKMGISFEGIKFDTKIAAYLIDSSKGEYELEDIIGNYLLIRPTGDDLTKQVKHTALLSKIFESLEASIKEANMDELLYEVEQPLTEVLAYMEYEGFKVDIEKLTELGDKFKVEISTIQKEIYDLAEEEFNINSPKQLGKILFEKLDLPVIKKTKTGYSTNAEVLDELSDKHPIIEKITYYRQLTKLYSTYIEGLKAVVDEDGKIHSSFNQTVTTTGRLSSTEPNLQNIPIKYEMGREIRKVFVPENDNCVILSADYSQIELRVLAHIANDENLIDAFVNHSDIHTKTASEVFRVPIDEVTPLQRSNAKAVNFGIVYGIGDFSLAKDLKISRKEAKNYIDTYFERYPGVKKYLDDAIEQAKEKLYVTTVMNRRRFIPEIKASNKMVRSFGERLAMNTPIQGSAADIIKLAMVNVYDELRKRNLNSKLILQVHDELIVNVHKEELEEVKAIVKKEMEEVLDLRVPLEVDINIGGNWYEAK